QALHVHLVGPPNAQFSLSDEDDGLELKASHEGYLNRYGVAYARHITLAPHGLFVRGEDRLSAPKGLKGEAQASGGGYTVRFHLHPTVKATLGEDERTVALILPNREAWVLTANTPTVAVEESVFLADERGPRRSLQVVLSGGMEEERDIRIEWTLERVAEAGPAGNAPGTAPPAA